MSRRDKFHRFLETPLITGTWESGGRENILSAKNLKSQSRIAVFFVTTLLLWGQLPIAPDVTENTKRKDVFSCTILFFNLWILFALRIFRGPELQNPWRWNMDMEDFQSLWSQFISILKTYVNIGSYGIYLSR